MYAEQCGKAREAKRKLRNRKSGDRTTEVTMKGQGKTAGKNERAARVGKAAASSYRSEGRWLRKSGCCASVWLEVGAGCTAMLDPN